MAVVGYALGFDPRQTGDRPLSANAFHGGRHGSVRLRRSVPSSDGDVRVRAQNQPRDSAQRARTIFAGKEGTVGR